MPVQHIDAAEALRTQSLSAASHAASSSSSPHSNEHLRQQEAKRNEETQHAAPAAKSKQAHEVDEGNKLETKNKKEDWSRFAASHVPPSAPPLASQSAGTATPVEGSKNISAAQLRRDLEHNVKA